MTYRSLIVVAMMAAITFAQSNVVLAKNTANTQQTAGKPAVQKAEKKSTKKKTPAKKTASAKPVKRFKSSVCQSGDVAKCMAKGNQAWNNVQDDSLDMLNTSQKRLAAAQRRLERMVRAQKGTAELKKQIADNEQAAKDADDKADNAHWRAVRAEEKAKKTQETADKNREQIKKNEQAIKDADDKADGAQTTADIARQEVSDVALVAQSNYQYRTVQIALKASILFNEEGVGGELGPELILNLDKDYQHRLLVGLSAGVSPSTALQVSGDITFLTRKFTGEYFSFGGGLMVTCDAGKTNEKGEGSWKCLVGAGPALNLGLLDMEGTNVEDGPRTKRLNFTVRADFGVVGDSPAELEFSFAIIGSASVTIW